MKIIEEENLLQNTLDLGKHLVGELQRLAGQSGGSITAVRGVGLMIGVQMRDDALARQVVDACRGEGLILETNLLAEAVIRFSPALNINRPRVRPGPGYLCAGVADPAIGF